VVAGFDPTDPDERTGSGIGSDVGFQEWTLALTKEVSGVRLTAEFLQEAVFRCAAAPYPESPP
jgi:hypothetical protein